MYHNNKFDVVRKPSIKARLSSVCKTVLFIFMIQGGPAFADMSVGQFARDCGALFWSDTELNDNNLGLTFLCAGELSGVMSLPQFSCNLLRERHLSQTSQAVFSVLALDTRGVEPSEIVREILLALARKPEISDLPMGAVVFELLDTDLKCAY